MNNSAFHASRTTHDPRTHDTGAPTMRWKVKKKRIPGNLKLDRRDCLRDIKRRLALEVVL